MHFLCKVVFCSCLFFCGLANSETFLAQTTDIPLMPGVIISPVEQMDFDTPAGQVIVLEGISKQKTDFTRITGFNKRQFNKARPHYCNWRYGVVWQKKRF